MSDEHKDHGRHSGPDGDPDDPDCPCRGTYKQVPCSKAGCGFCLATVHKLQRVVCAAMRNHRGTIVCGPRHYDSVMRSQIDMDQEQWDETDGPIEQGFVDQFGNFLTREEALIIAKTNNQIVRRVGGDERRLDSSNLY